MSPAELAQYWCDVNGCQNRATQEQDVPGAGDPALVCEAHA